MREFAWKFQKRVRSIYSLLARVDYCFTWGSLQQLILVLIDINGITDFTKSRCNNIKWLLRALGTIQPSMFGFPFSFIVSWALSHSPSPSVGYMLNIRLGTSPTRSATYIYICILFTARPAPSRHVPFVCNPSIRPFSVYFSAPLHPPVIIQLIF